MEDATRNGLVKYDKGKATFHIDEGKHSKYCPDRYACSDFRFKSVENIPSCVLKLVTFSVLSPTIGRALI